ncbi:gustatory and odorant receptor 63a [Drosophila grimshawi]|uniref:Gustatory receptor n=1 Tax=Drosophila grimshawi TaxID=7222 RepID=B4IZW7_DROGR|nr:gustatory and odorant receptor 63a [Drosophila grimshawi]EDV96739.1 GH15044 [Drosophila grimshawi]
MASYYRRKKPDTVFLNANPINSSNAQAYLQGVRKYSIGLAERLDSGYQKPSNDRKRSSVTTVDSQSLGTFTPSVFYRNIAPVNWFLRIIGVLPIVRSGPSRAKFALNTAPFLYSVIFFTLLACYVGYVAKNRIHIVRSLSGPFEEAVIAYLFLVNILPVMVIPILWWEARKIARLFNDWDDFEVLYYQISGHSLPLNLRQKAIYIAIGLPIISVLSVVIIHMTMSDLNLNQVVPYCILDNLTAMLGAWWFIICEAISTTAYLLAERFQKALKHIGPAAMVADYRVLWLRLSKLTRDTGNALCYTFVFMSLYLFFIITLSIYGLMSQLSEGFGIKDIGLTITALWNIGLLFYICDQAHYASVNVRTNFQKKLLMVELNWMNMDAQTEINMFLRATEMNPSNINCGGFFDVDRSLFKGLLTTMVTYLVVLLQFQISIPTDKGDGDGDGNANMTVIDLLMDSMNNDMTVVGHSSTTPGTTAAPTTTTNTTTTPVNRSGGRGRKG